VPPKLLKKAAGFLFDLDGVLYVGNRIVPGAIETIEHIKSRKIPCRYTTNTTTKSLDTLHAKLTRFGLPIQKDEIFSATTAAAMYLRHQGKPTCFFLLTDDPLKDFAEFQMSDTTPDYVVVGDVGKRWDYEMINRVFNLIINGAELVALHKGRYWQVEDGLRIDMGAFVAGLEYCTGKTATVIGKPSPSFFMLALENMGLSARKVVMIGDDIHNDIGGAQKAGMKAVLVRTGKYREELVTESGIKPDMTIESVADLCNLV